MKLNKPTSAELALLAKQQQTEIKKKNGKWGHNSKFIPNTQHGSPGQW